MLGHTKSNHEASSAKYPLNIQVSLASSSFTHITENIPLQITRLDLIYALRDVLHQPPLYEGDGRPPNFSVQLDQDPTGEFEHGGTGTLTIADELVVAVFISMYGDPNRPRFDSTSDWDQGELTFSLSQPPPPDLIQELENTPFVDPRVAQGREARRAALSATVGLQSVQFGWLCRDHRFSVEWQADIPSIIDLPANNTPSLRFNAVSNEIWISLAVAITYNGTTHAMVVTRFSGIEAIIVDAAERSTPGILFTFFSPPALEYHEVPRTFPGREPNIRRFRLTSFNSTHAPIAPYTLFAMRVTCASQAQMDEFRRMARVANLPRPTDAVPSPIVRRSLFSTQPLDRIHAWLETLPWSVAFQILSILYAAALDPIELWNIRPSIEALVSDADFGVAKAGKVLRGFGAKVKDPAALIQDDESILRCFESVKADLRRATFSSGGRSRNPGVFNCYHATVTPTRILLDGPFLDQSNRVLREYPAHQEYFLRVNFRDEDNLQFRWDRKVDGVGFVKERVGGVLEGGLNIAGRHFEFLAYSNSALRDHAVWFSAPFQEAESEGPWVTAQSIRDGLGDFDYKNLDRQPAKLAARMSQAFTATEPGVKLDIDGDIPIFDDIERNDSIFTDGVGEISRALSRRIVRALEKSGRAKRFFGDEIRLRNSQQKFISPLTHIEIAQSFYRAKPFYLNRFLIMILETLGVPADVFLGLQRAAIRDVEAATESFSGCAEFLDINGCGTSYHISSVFLHLTRLGLTLGGQGPTAVRDGFLNRSIRFAKHHVLREMKHKARIPVKGDVQFVEAIGKPPAGSLFEDERYTNCVVFSTQGERSVPSMLAGGDLDGDEYNLILDTSLFPPSCYPPAQYPSVPPKTLDRTCITKDLTDWVTDYINSDILGLVCHQFLVTADSHEEMCLHEDCILLAGLASRAVDFAKSGVPVGRGELPEPPEGKPDWSVGEIASARSINSATYESQTAIGKLFRHIDLNRVHRDVTRQANREHGDDDDDEGLETSVEELERVLNSLSRPSSRNPVRHPITDAVQSSLHPNYIDTSSRSDANAIAIMRRIYPSYIAELRLICSHHSITKQPLTEEEVIMGTIASRTSQPRQRKEMIQRMRVQADELVKRIHVELKEPNEEGELEADDEDFNTLERRLQVAWLAWRLSVEQRKTFGAKSFGFIALTAIFDGMRAIDVWRAENGAGDRSETPEPPTSSRSPALPVLPAPQEAPQEELVYVTLRAQANAEGDAMSKCFRESQEAYRSGDGARAKELSNQGKLHKAEMEELNKKAAEWIFLVRNLDRPPHVIDLHGLYVNEAIERTNLSLIAARERGDRQLHLIVGRGMHSRDSVGKLRVAIENLMTG
ncbi:hypothetical protein FRC01_005314, partial [Tulasnella sp. 417]